MGKYKNTSEVSIGNKLISASNGGFTFREALVLQLAGNSQMICTEKSADKKMININATKTADYLVQQADAIIEYLDKEA